MTRGESSGINLRNVWYRSRPPRAGMANWFPVLGLAMEDSGELQILGDALTFTGRRFRLESSKILNSETRKFSGDWINAWVHVTCMNASGESIEIYLADGNVFGWSGVFGGTRRLGQVVAGRVGAGQLTN